MRTEVIEIQGINHLLCEMTSIVLKRMEGFQSDFFVYDTRALFQAFKETDEPQFVWFVRDNGTHMYTINQEGLIKRAEYLLSSHRDKIDVYFISKSKLVKLCGTKEEILEWMSPKGLYSLTEVL